MRPHLLSQMPGATTFPGLMGAEMYRWNTCSTTPNTAIAKTRVNMMVPLLSFFSTTGGGGGAVSFSVSLGGASLAGAGCVFFFFFLASSLHAFASIPLCTSYAKVKEIGFSSTRFNKNI